MALGTVAVKCLAIRCCQTITDLQPMRMRGCKWGFISFCLGALFCGACQVLFKVYISLKDKTTLQLSQHIKSGKHQRNLPIFEADLEKAASSDQSSSESTGFIMK